MAVTLNEFNVRLSPEIIGEDIYFFFFLAQPPSLLLISLPWLFLQRTSPLSILVDMGRLYSLALKVARGKF